MACFHRRFLRALESSLTAKRTPEEFPWSIAGVEKNLDAARTSA